MPIMDDLVAILRGLLRKMTQGELANDLGVSQATVSRWLQGMDPSGSRRQKITELAIEAGLITDRPMTAKSGRGRLTHVPLLSWVSAGRLEDRSTQEEERNAPIFTFADLTVGDFFCLKVQGDSMDRISPEGSIIVVDRADKLLVAGKPYVFATHGEATYKLWRPEPPRLDPFSTNPMNQPIFVKRKIDLVVVGRVKRSILYLE